MRKFVESFLEDVKVLILFVIFSAAVYCSGKIISSIDFSSEKVVEVMTEKDVFMQECMKRMANGKSHLQYDSGICNKRWEEKNK